MESWGGLGTSSYIVYPNYILVYDPQQSFLMFQPDRNYAVFTCVCLNRLVDSFTKQSEVIKNWYGGWEGVGGGTGLLLYHIDIL